MPENAVIVFTGRPPEQIIFEGGTQAWVLSPRRARKCEYAVCVQNRYTHEHFSPTEPHGTAFIVGRISEVDLSVEQPAPEENRPERFIIRFREYARISLPNAWDGSRNPVGYIDITTLGIDVSSLDFQPLSAAKGATPSIKEDPAPPESGDRPLTLAQAKAGLALTFGVPPEAIEITIRG